MKGVAATAIVAGVIAAAAFATRVPMLGIGRRREPPRSPRRSPGATRRASGERATTSPA
jgi:hypothetical protein